MVYRLGGIRRGKDGTRPTARTMDWEQDAGIIFPAVNKSPDSRPGAARRYTGGRFTAGLWRLMMDIFSQVLSIRQKLAKGKKLEKWEQEFLRNNQKLCELKGAANGTQGDYEFSLSYWGEVSKF